MEDEKKVNLLSNAPQCHDSYKKFSKILDSAISDKRNKNIGIIGDFGSGKSSAIQTFIEIDGVNKKILKVSLAEFNYTKTTDEKGQQNYENDLQFAIVQQLIYSSKRKYIPDSKILNKGYTKRKTFLGIFFFLCLISILFYVIPVKFWFFRDEPKWYFAFTILFGFLALLFLFLVLKPGNIKAKVKDVEIQAEFNFYKEPFNLYLDEMIYFFRKTQPDVVVFEDIDRCKDSEKLFTKLYTLNTLVNNLPEYKDKGKTVVFLHSVREDIFKDYEQKSKYFDILLPVKPVFSAQSSLDRLKESLGENVKYFDENFLLLVSLNFLYMRQMNNVVNAFNVIKDSYGSETNKDAYQRLFVLLLYKSLFADDYICFIKGKSCLNFIISKNIDELDALGLKDYFNSDYAFKTNKTSEDDFRQIVLFYKTYSGFIDNRSIGLISSYPDNNFLTERDRISLSSIIANYDIDYINEKIDNVRSILDYKDIEKFVGNICFNNFSILNELITNKKYSNLYNLYVNTFEKIDDKKIKLLNIIIKNSIENGEYNYNEFLQNVSEKLTFFTKDFIQPDETKYLSFMLSKIVKKKSSVQIQDKESNLSTLLSKNNESVRILCECSDEILDYLFSLEKFSIAHVNQCNHEKYKTIILKILSSNKFDVTNENLKCINSFLTNINSKNAIFSNLSMIENGSSVISSVINQINYKKIELDSVIDDYSNEKPELLYSLLTDVVKDVIGFNKVYETCPILTYASGRKMPWFNAIKLISFNKLMGTIDDFAEIKLGDQTKKIDYANYIINNVDLLLKGIPQTEEGNLLLTSILKSKHCDYSIAGKLMEKTSEKGNLVIGNFETPSDALYCALDYEYISIGPNFMIAVGNDEELLKKITTDNYINQIVGYIPTIKLSSNIQQLVFICKNTSFENQIKLATKYPITISSNIKEFKFLMDNDQCAQLDVKIIKALIDEFGFLFDKGSFYNSVKEKIDVAVFGEMFKKGFGTSSKLSLNRSEESKSFGNFIKANKLCKKVIAHSHTIDFYN